MFLFYSHYYYEHFSPWVCNCGHSWKNHTQSTTQQQVISNISRYMTENSQNNENINEIITTAMDGNAMNDMNMLYRQDGR